MGNGGGCVGGGLLDGAGLGLGPVVPTGRRTSRPPPTAESAARRCVSCTDAPSSTVTKSTKLAEARSDL